MKLLTFLLLCGCAQAKPTMPVPHNLQYGPFSETRFNATGQEIEKSEWRLIDGGRRAEHVVTYRSGLRQRFILELPKLK